MVLSARRLVDKLDRLHSRSNALFVMVILPPQSERIPRPVLYLWVLIAKWQLDIDVDVPAPPPAHPSLAVWRPTRRARACCRLEVCVLHPIRRT